MSEPAAPTKPPPRLVAVRFPGATYRTAAVTQITVTKTPRKESHGKPR